MGIFKFVLLLLILNCSLSNATIRYVSHSGNSTPPYTSWETAADSIQKCINYCFAGDTIIVANGTYYESLIVDKYLSLIGSSVDSTIIDGTGLANTTIDAQSDFEIFNFYLIGKERAEATFIIGSSGYNVNVQNCRLEKAGDCISTGEFSGKLNNLIFTNCNTAFYSICIEDTCHPKISNSILIMSNSALAGIDITDGGNPTITKNIILGDRGPGTGEGISIGWAVSTAVIRNNIVSGFNNDINMIAPYIMVDSAVVENNIAAYVPENNFGWAGIVASWTSIIRNNIFIYNNVGLDGQTNPNDGYNLYWGNKENVTGEITIDSTDVLANPMFVNDTIPVYGGTFDFHLQAYSPAIDAGDPNILDVDGTRSDIGVFGGPLGESYTYQDLAPRAPVNLTAVLDTNKLLLTWNKNTEADFKSYRIYRDTTEGFIIDSTKLISEQSDTFFVQIVPREEINLYYKLTAVDSQGNQSGPSEEVHIVISSIKTKEPIVLNDYKLYQNYPNPYNPTTKIGYRLKERGYVKLMVYDIKGEMIDVLVNKVQGAGYYEVEFSGRNLIHQIHKNDIASGIYLYRIEVIGKGNIPRFSDMKKMILLK
jgi:hypothetical protein